MARLRIFIIAAALLLLIAGVSAADITLFGYAINQDGVVSNGGSIPGNVDMSGFDTAAGLGTITVTLDQPGTHTVLGFFDHEIDEQTNTFFNELGGVGGSPAPGEVWEIDEPGFVAGNIYTNFVAMSLENQNDILEPDDVSMAIGWKDFSLADGETATIGMTLSTTAPSSGFYLVHTDPESEASIYLQSSLMITGTPAPVPEFPGLVMPLAITMMLLAVIAIRRIPS